MMMASTGKMESYKEETKDPADAYAVWDRELAAALKHYEKYHGISDTILKRYRDERGDADGGAPAAKINLFWSNTQVLKSTLYTRPPKVDVSRLFRDFEDDTARVAGVIMERMLNHDLEKDSSDFDVAVRQCIDDWLIVGQGQLWYRYDVVTREVEVPPALPMPMASPDVMMGAMQPPGIAPPVQYAMGPGEAAPPAPPQPGMAPPNDMAMAMPPQPGMAPPAPMQPPPNPIMEEVIDNEDALSDYVYWRDYLCSPARTWGEVRWVARRVYMTRDALVERFGEKKGSRVPLAQRTATGAPKNTGDGNNDDPWATAEVWEIWCKTNRKVYWVSRGFEEFLDQRDDPLELENFFPCPEPMLANKTNNTLIPRADYSMARDQYQQIDVLAARLRILIDACKVRGVFDKESAPALQNILTGPENKMVPVDSWALFAEKGGLKGVMDFVPIEQIAAVIQILRADLAEQKQELYETLGIADIMRGATRASETATAQQIKAQFGSTRLQFKQYEVARFVRDAQRIKADIIARHFQPETLKERSNVERTPDAQHADQAIALIKDRHMSQYRLNVEADSMAALDWANERESRTQFMQAIGGFVQSMMPLAQAEPASTPVLLKLLQWGLAGFRAGKEIEGVLDQAVQGMAQKPPGPSPQEKALEEAMKAAELKKVQSEGQKNEATAVKTMSEANTNRIQNASDAQIMQAMGAGMPVMDSAQEASYVPPNQGGM